MVLDALDGHAKCRDGRQDGWPIVAVACEANGFKVGKNFAEKVLSKKWDDGSELTTDEAWSQATNIISEGIEERCRGIESCTVTNMNKYEEL